MRSQLGLTKVYGGLLVLLAVTVGAAFLHLGALHAVIAFAVGALQMTLIAIYFMQLRTSSQLTWTVAGASLLWLGILFALVLSDYATRSWVW
jgi:cytochrome c oxidase subunit 4